jgi:L-fuculokinase
MPYALVLDCGATNVRAGAVDEKGRIVHIESAPNAAIRERPDRDWLIWDLESIWDKLLACAARTVAAAGHEDCAALVVTSFSDDGAPLDGEGNLLYPVISWQCGRTAGIVGDIGKSVGPQELYRITGEQTLPQHTLFKLLWLRENAPRSLEKAERYVMFPHILNYRLTGRYVNDPTTADSMFLLDILRRRYSERLLGRFGFDESLFPELLEPGERIGSLLEPMAEALGLRGNVPVIVGGHDTQFAVLGSGCRLGEMVLSSGTWEILFARTERCFLSRGDRLRGLKNECDAAKGVFNLGAQWLGSGALEWLGELLYPEIGDKPGRYEAARREASASPPGSQGVRIRPDLVPGTLEGRGAGGLGGRIEGIKITTRRGDLYRAMLEGLCEKLYEGVRLIGKAARIAPKALTVVGGGSRNALWNQMRADRLGIPIQLTSQTENTLVGAAMVGFVGSGRYADLDEARAGISFAGERIEPGMKAGASSPPLPR